MIKPKYLKRIVAIVKLYGRGRKAKFFIFGSSLERDHFGDVDIGVAGNFETEEINALKQAFTESTLPYFFDIIDFDHVSRAFKKNTLSNKVLWLKR
ncbi:MAG: hypothetical protein AAB791_01520 [Patescibacteria group bacterium]